MLYGFQKLYIDAITDDDTVVIVYVSRSYLLGYPFMQAMIEIYGPEGSARSIRGHVASKSGTLDEIVAAGLLEVGLPDGDITIQMKPAHGTWKPYGRPISPCVDWSVSAAAMDISIDITTATGCQHIRGVGYADLVELTQFPRRLGIAQLDWGRVHWPGYSVVYDCVHFHNGMRWKRGGIWSENSFTEVLHHVDIDVHAGEMQLGVAGHSFVFRPVRLLRAGQALDASRFPNVVERFITRAVAGELAEKRWLSHVYDDVHDQPGKAIHERVLFGPTYTDQKAIHQEAVSQEVAERHGIIPESPVYVQ